MPKVKNKPINLIPQDEFETSIVGRILKWALSSFRIMVIMTELVVMSAFLSRFWLDARNSDLNEELNISSAQILAYSDVESTFRIIQKKLAIAKNIYAEPKANDLLNTIVKSTPSDVTLNTVTISNELINIKALSFSENSIAQMLINLNSIKNFGDVSLKQISTDTENANVIVFNISAKVNQIN